jgi:hypothetical protein
VVERGALLLLPFPALRHHHLEIGLHTHIAWPEDQKQEGRHQRTKQKYNNKTIKMKTKKKQSKKKKRSK